MGNDHLVSDGLNKCSMPYDLIGERVNLRLTPNTVEAFFRSSRVAVHVRSKIFHRDPVVKQERIFAEHRMYLEYNEKVHRERQYSWPSGICCGGLLSDQPKQGCKCCASMTKLADRYGSVRLENACQRLQSFSSTSPVRTQSTILKNGQDRVWTPSESTKTTVQHGIFRAADYFRRGGSKLGTILPLSVEGYAVQCHGSRAGAPDA